MNAAAWLPLRRAGNANCGMKFGRQRRTCVAMIRYVKGEFAEGSQTLASSWSGIAQRVSNDRLRRRHCILRRRPSRRLWCALPIRSIKRYVSASTTARRHCRGGRASASRCRRLRIIVLDRRVLRLLRLSSRLFRRLAFSCRFRPYRSLFRRLDWRLLCMPIRSNRMISIRSRWLASYRWPMNFPALFAAFSLKGRHKEPV